MEEREWMVGNLKLSDDELAELQTLLRKATPEGADKADPNLLTVQERSRLALLFAKATDWRLEQ
jgi:hypothetical protein